MFRVLQEISRGQERPGSETLRYLLHYKQVASRSPRRWHWSCWKLCEKCGKGLRSPSWNTRQLQGGGEHSAGSAWALRWSLQLSGLPNWLAHPGLRKTLNSWWHSPLVNSHGGRLPVLLVLNHGWIRQRHNTRPTVQMRLLIKSEISGVVGFTLFGAHVEWFSHPSWRMRWGDGDRLA